MWWANKQWSNWNGVCAGGMGIMADDMVAGVICLVLVQMSVFLLGLL